MMQNAGKFHRSGYCKQLAMYVVADCCNVQYHGLYAVMFFLDVRRKTHTQLGGKESKSFLAKTSVWRRFLLDD